MGKSHSKFRRKYHKHLVRYKALLGFGKKTFDINIKLQVDDQEEPVTPLWLAVKCDDVDLVRVMLRHGADPNMACGGLRMSPLHMAAYNHNVLMLRVLLQALANPNVLDNWNYSPLIYAATHHDATTATAMIQLLLDSGADPNFGATRCSTSRQFELPPSEVNSDLPLLRSSYDGDAFAYNRVPVGPTSGTALHVATQNPHLGNNALEMLLEAGADVDKLNLHAQTPLMRAIADVYYDYHRNVKSHAELLLARGASPNAQDIRGWNSFHYAVQRGSISAMTLLMDYNCDCEALSMNKESALWLLLAHDWREAAKYLMCSGCDLNRPIKSMTLLAINHDIEVCRYGNIYPIESVTCNYKYDLAELMLDLGVQVNRDTWPVLPKKEKYLQQHVNLLKRIKKRRLDECHKVQSLQGICRVCIRAYLQQNICSKVKVLTLPCVLKDYLCYMPLSSLVNDTNDDINNTNDDNINGSNITNDNNTDTELSRTYSAVLHAMDTVTLEELTSLELTSASDNG